MSAAGTPVVLRLFVSSPGDVPEERQATRSIVERLNREPLLVGQAVLQAVLWEDPGTGMPLLATTTPQDALNRGMCRPSECDLALVILAARLGTALPREVNGQPFLKPDNTPYRSGTEWEYLDAIRGHQENTLPEVIVFRRTPLPPLHPADPEYREKQVQRNLVEAFFAEFTNADGSLARGVESYRTPADFKTLAERHVRRLIPLILEKRRHGAGPGGRPVGQCPACGHMHGDWQKRRGCERCSALIREPCLKCGTLAGVWSKFCGHCRIDLAKALRGVAGELTSRQQEIARLMKQDRAEAALSLLQRTPIPDHSALASFRQWFTDQGDRLRKMLNEATSQRRQLATDDLKESFEQQARKGKWIEAGQTLTLLRQQRAGDPWLIEAKQELAEGLREQVRERPEDQTLRALYLTERTSKLEDDDEAAGQQVMSRLRWIALPVCVVICPLILALPLILGFIARLDAARRYRRYGPLPFRALRLSEVELQRRYRPGGAAGRFEQGFNKLRLE